MQSRARTADVFFFFAAAAAAAADSSCCRIIVASQFDHILLCFCNKIVSGKLATVIYVL